MTTATPASSQKRVRDGAHDADVIRCGYDPPNVLEILKVFELHTSEYGVENWLITFNLTLNQFKPLRSAARRFLRKKCGINQFHAVQRFSDYYTAASSTTSPDVDVSSFATSSSHAVTETSGVIIASAGDEKRWWQILGSGSKDAEFSLIKSDVLETIPSSKEFESLRLFIDPPHPAIKQIAKIEDIGYAALEEREERDVAKDIEDVTDVLEAVTLANRQKGTEIAETNLHAQAVIHLVPLYRAFFQDFVVWEAQRIRNNQKL